MQVAVVGQGGQVLRFWCVRQAEGLGESADKVGVGHGVLFLWGWFYQVLIFSGSLLWAVSTFVVQAT